MNIKSIELVYENCEVQKILAEDILKVGFEFYDQVPYMNRNKILKGFILKFHWDGSSTQFQHTPPKNRALVYNDICWVILNLDNDQEIQYGIEWTGGDPYGSNHAQVTRSIEGDDMVEIIVDCDGWYRMMGKTREDYEDIWDEEE